MNAFVEYFRNIQEHNGDIGYIHSCPELIDCIRQVGFLPLLESGIQGYAAESLMAEECRFTQFPDGTWEWPLWQWKGSVVREGGCVYGKFFAGKAGFISREWWPDFYNWRRSNMRSKFDAYVGRLQMGTHIVTEDFVYPVDKHGREYGFGWSLLTTPERLIGREACLTDRTPEESYQRMVGHLAGLLPNAIEKQIKKLLK